ncbi:MAG: class I SAM-dependent methyltransferase [Betaproteobacteria bacterium]
MQRSSRHDAVLQPSRWIARFAGLVAPGARVLDVAAGTGRHARLFAARGAEVVAVDRDEEALAALRDVTGIQTRVADLEGAAWPLSRENFDAIVVTNYLHRPRLRDLLGALAGDGVLLYETFAAGNERFGRPSKPDFLLRNGELLDVVRGYCTVVAFEQGSIENGAQPAVVQRLAAVGPKRAWPPPLPEPVQRMDVPR